MLENVYLLAAAAPEGGNLVTNITTQFGVNWSLFLSQLIAFLIVAWALKKWAYGPVLDVLEKRQQRIAEGLSNAEKIKTELAQAEATRKEMLTRAGVDANKLIEEARAAAAKVQEVETQKAIAEAKQIIEKAREAGNAELLRLKAELRQEFGRLVVQTAGRVTGDILSADQKGRLADDAVRQLAA